MKIRSQLSPPMLCLRAFAISLVIAVACVHAQGFVPGASTVVTTVVKPLIKHPQALPGAEIVRLATLGSKTGGTKEIGRILGSMKLPDAVIEDTYLRIAIQQSKIQVPEAEGMMIRLRGTPGFRSTLSKVVGASDAKTSGHLNELRIADKASENGFKVIGIGTPFVDPNKPSPTDIDIILKGSKRIYAIEAKNYRSETNIPLDMVRADMVTLNVYTSANSGSQVLPIFAISNQPSSELSRRILTLEAERRGIELLYGSPGALVDQIKQLEKLP